MRKINKYLIVLVFMFVYRSAYAEITLIPWPQKIEICKGELNLGQSLVIRYDDSFSSEAIMLKQYLKQLDISVHLKKGNGKGEIHLLKQNISSNNTKEAYLLKVTNNNISLIATHSTGIFYAIQSLRQLWHKNNKGLSVPYVDIFDYPTFSWRSFMLDEGRYFKGKEIVKQIIDEMAALKMNIFHWHLTDDQGWRLEINKYPKLTTVGSYRDSTQIDWYEYDTYDGKPHQGFYTQKEIKEILEYAKKRHIQIVPEIEMPGHCAAAVAAYPWLSAAGKSIKVPCKFGVQYDVFNVTDARVLQFLEDVIDEVIALFPSPIIHIGGDEVRYDQWNASEQVQKFMKCNKIDQPSGLQVWFTNEMSAKIAKKGRRMMGWNDITGDKLHHFQESNNSFNTNEMLSPETIVQFWKGDKELILNTAEKGYDIVNSDNRFTYINYSYTYSPLEATYEFCPISLEKAYSFSPIPTGFPEHLKSKILGGGCQMWGEWIPTVESMNEKIYPRLAAYAEVLWTAIDQKNYSRFKKGLLYFLDNWQSLGITYGPVEVK